MYKTISRNKLFAWPHFMSWLLLAFFHSVIIYYFGRQAWNDNNALYDEGRTMEFLCYGVYMIHNVVVITNLKLVIDGIYRTYVFLATVWLSIFGFVLTTYIYNLFNA